jgi:UDP-glucose 4-epimerase
MGAIGSWVVRRLIDDGQPFVVYDWRADYSLLPDLAGEIDFVQGDILDRDQLASVIQESRARRIIHLAALMPPDCESNPSRGYQVNLMGTLSVLDVARDLQLERVVFTSSKASYGTFTGEHAAPGFKPVTEEYEGVSPDVYGSTKKAEEDAARHYRRLWNLDLIALRLGSTYGPGKLARHGSLSLKSSIVEMGYRGEPLTVPTPDLTDDTVYNRDVAKAVLLACFAPTPEHWQFNVSSESLVSLRTFTEEVMRRCPNHRLTIDERSVAPDRPGTNCLLSNARAREELGYTPDFPGVAGVADYLEHIQRHQILSPAAP